MTKTKTKEPLIRVTFSARHGCLVKYPDPNVGFGEEYPLKRYTGDCVRDESYAYSFRSIDERDKIGYTCPKLIKLSKKYGANGYVVFNEEESRIQHIFATYLGPPNADCVDVCVMYSPRVTEMRQREKKEGLKRADIGSKPFISFILTEGDIRFYKLVPIKSNEREKTSLEDIYFGNTNAGY